MKRILLVVCLVALCRTAEAQQVIIGNSVTGPYRTGTNIGAKSLGFRTGSVGVYIYDIQVALGGLSSGGGGSVTFTLNADNSGCRERSSRRSARSPSKLASLLRSRTRLRHPISPI